MAELPITDTLAAAVEAAATRLKDAVRAELANPPGGAHDTPWRQTGGLQASIEYTPSGLTACIGSNDPAASAQEHGTATIPPRPFLAPIAAKLAGPITNDIADALASLLARAMT